MGPNPQFGYELQHQIDECTAEVIKDLKTGSMSFQLYAYPNSAEIPPDDGGAAIKARLEGKAPAAGGAAAGGQQPMAGGQYAAG